MKKGITDPHLQEEFGRPIEQHKETTYTACHIFADDKENSANFFQDWTTNLPDRQSSKVLIINALPQNTYGRSPFARRDRPYTQKHKILKIKQIQRIPLGRLEMRTVEEEANA